MKKVKRTSSIVRAHAINKNRKFLIGTTILTILSLIAIFIAFSDFGSVNLPAMPEQVTTANWGFSGSTQVTGDFDGDGNSDLAIWGLNSTGSGNWYIYSVAKNQTISWELPWGFKDSTALSGDFDGDNISDLAIWGLNSTGSGNWYIYSVAKNQTLLWNFAWGSLGMTPLVGDFDADNKDDIAVWAPAPLGKWYIYSVAKPEILLWDFQYGVFPGMTPIVGDFDGDSSTDIGLYGLDNGNWWVYSLRTQSNIFWYYNFSNNQGEIVKNGIPVPADYNGDGTVEPAVYDAINKGYWEINSRKISVESNFEISGLLPRGVLNRTTVLLRLNTSSNAICTFEVPYLSETSKVQFNITGGVYHTFLIKNLTNGTKIYNIDCKEQVTAAEARGVITFVVNTSYGSLPVQNSSIFTPLPAGIVNGTSILLSVNTSVNANCSYSRNASLAFVNMTLFNITGGVYHTSLIENLTNGTQTFYILCVDEDGNIIGPNVINFTVNTSSNGSIPSVITCVDSDGGLNYSVWGNITSGNLAPGVTSRVDVCVNSTRLREKICLNNLGSNQVYDCPNGCLNGACISSVSQNNLTINVSINPQIVISTLINNYTLFITLGSNSTADFASVSNASGYNFCTNVTVGGTCSVYNFTLLFQYINATTGIVIIEVITPGFEIHQPPIPACVDSDDGLDYYSWGNITSGNLAPGVTSRVDVCVNSTRLREKICLNNLGSNQVYDCPNGCLNGVCNTGCLVNETWNGITCVSNAEQAQCNVSECFYNPNVCLVDGYRILNNSIRFYCNVSEFLIQKPVNSTCTWDNECESNLCGNGLCLELVEGISGPQNLLTTFWCAIQSFFGVSNPNCSL